MKKTKSDFKSSLPWIAVAAILATVATIVAIILIANYNNKQNIYPFTYLSTSENSAQLFSSEDRFFPAGDYLINSNYVLSLLVKGPRSDALISPFPSNTKILSVVAGGQLLHIDISSEYLNQNNFEMLLSDYCIVATLSEMDIYDGFVLSVAGTPHPIHGSTVITENTFLSNLSGFSPISRQITFYLPNLDKNILETHVYTLNMYLSDDILELTVQKLLELLSLSDTQLLSLSLDSGLLTIDLSDEIVFYASLNSTYAELMLYSIVDTMVSLPNISLVRIIIEGEPIQYFGDTAADQPFTPNTDLIGDKVTVH